MRLKLVLIASLAAAVVGSGISIVIILVHFSSLKAISTPGALAALILGVPVVAVVLAAVFVYRHTARRRKTQALLTGVLGAFLSLAVFIVVTILTSRPAPTQPPQPTVPTNVG